MNEPTETDREWNEGISPCCKVMNATTIEESMLDELTYYARKHGGGDASITWGRLRARNALRDGRSPSYAYDVGRQAIDDVLGSVGRMSRHPVTDAWKAAQAMGVVDIHCTATGVVGHKKADIDGEPHWFDVRVDAEGSEPQMRLGE